MHVVCEMDKTLVLFTNSFPFGRGETFIDNEIAFYKGFSAVFIVAIDYMPELRFTNLPGHVVVCQLPELSIYSKLYWYLRALFRPEFYRELPVLFKTRKYFWIKLHALLAFVGLGERVLAYASENISVCRNKRETVFYSYWLHHGAYAAVRMKKKFGGRSVSRCHGYDLYANRNKTDYLPLRRYLGMFLDKIFPISENGLSYLQRIVGGCGNENLCLSRLGTVDYGVKNNVHLGEVLRVVSCSWCSPVKRIYRIVETLRGIEDMRIEWTHIGGGYEDGKFEKELAVLPPNIQVVWKGEMKNADICKHYKEYPYHIFLNVSESEGIPVSIMEALSCGIPVIATNVGGVGEIVEEGYNGFLLDKDFSDGDLYERLKDVACMADDDYQVLREHARAMWEERYNSSVNYGKFVRMLDELF